MSPEMKLFTMVCRPKPTPTPKAPVSRVRRFTSTPMVAIATRKPRSRIT